MIDKDWSKLNRIELGRIGKSYAEKEFASYGFTIESSADANRGNDFGVNNRSGRYDVKVRSVRGYKYIFFQKDKFLLRSTLLAVVLIFFQKQSPEIYLIPSLAWEKPNGLLVSYDYIGKKSEPEWGINFSGRSLPLLEQYRFSMMVRRYT
jgi:hypothetical protein